MKAIAIVRQEGDEWEPFEREIEHFDLRFNRGCGGAVHAIKFSNGAVWDTVNGFRRRALPRVRVPMGRREIA